MTKNPTQEEYGPTKELVRTCEEDVELAKCEGSCVSSTQPSAMERWENDARMMFMMVFMMRLTLEIFERLQIVGTEPCVSSFQPPLWNVLQL